MTITTTGTAPRLTALQRYERLVEIGEDPSIYVNWSLIAADLRIEADQYIDDRRTDRIDRALDCDERATRVLYLSRDSRLTLRPGNERMPMSIGLLAGSGLAGAL